MRYIGVGLVASLLAVLAVACGGTEEVIREVEVEKNRRG